MKSSYELYPSLKALNQTAARRLNRAANLLTHPVETLSDDPLAPERLTQLLVGEAIEILEETPGWMRIQALHQPKWCEKEGRFLAYEGWIREQAIQAISLETSKETSKEVPLGGGYLVTSHQALIRKEPGFDSPLVASPEMGSFLVVDEREGGWHRVLLGQGTGWIYDKDVALFDWMEDQSEASWRWQWCESALRLRSSTYLLGGLGLICNAQRQRGIDCSGLLHLIARRLGLLLPRDAKDQYRWLHRLGLAQIEPVLAGPSSLKSGDLLFLGEGPPETIDHVMIYQGEGEWLESTRRHGGFWESTTEGRLGELKRGSWCKNRQFYPHEGFHSSLQMKNVYAVRSPRAPG